MGCPLSSSITSNARKKGSPTCLSLVVVVVVVVVVVEWFLILKE